MRLTVDPETVKGFLHPEEGQRLYELALAAAELGPCLEVGSYCGKSTVYLGCACRERNQLLYAVDHHRGSEEHQLGEEYHDPALFDADAGMMDSFREFRRTLDRADLNDTVVPLVAPSGLAGRYWGVPLALVFIDGGHSEAAALTDYRTWAPRLAPGGVLVIHDIFENPEDGGQAPHQLWRLAQASGFFKPLGLTRTLGALRRLAR